MNAASDKHLAEIPARQVDTQKQSPVGALVAKALRESQPNSVMHTAPYCRLAWDPRRVKAAVPYLRRDDYSLMEQSWVRALDAAAVAAVAAAAATKPSWCTGQ
jgi:hypothetical protein